MTTRLGRTLLAATAASALLLAACGGTTTPNPDDTAPATGGTQPAAPQANSDSPRQAENKLVVQARQDPGTLDYTKNTQTALLLWVPGNVVEPLLTRTPDGDIGPGLADYTVDDDNTTYVFTLKPNKFSTGEDVTIEDVLFSMKTMQESPVAQHAGAYAQVESMDITGDMEITVQLKQPSQAFLQGMASVAGLVQPEANFGEIATNPIGTGPYKVVEYTPNSRFLFTANENFQGTQPAIPDIEVRIITDGAATINALKSGEVDGAPVLTNDLWERMVSEKLPDALYMTQSPIRGEKQYLVLNQNGPLTKDIKVRQAFAAALDRSQLVAAVNADWAMTATCDYGVGSDPWVKPESAETCPFPADPELAAQLASELGLDSTPAEFVSLSDVPDLSLPADVLIEQFKSVGITTERNAIDLARYSQTIFQGRPPQFEVTNMSDPAGITQFICASEADAGWTTYCSPEFTEIAAEADLAPTVPEYYEALAAANEQLKKDAVIVPLTNTMGIGLWHPNLKGVDEQPTILIEAPLYKLSWS